MKEPYYNKETGEYDLMRQLQDMADASERMKNMPLPFLGLTYKMPDKEQPVRMLTPPMSLWDKISQKEWNAMSDEEQDEIVKKIRDEEQ